MTEETQNPELLNRQPKWFKKVFHGIIIASILFVLAIVILSPLPFRRSTRGSHQTQTVNNARQIGFAIFEFENDYGAFPNETTKTRVEETFTTGIDLSGNSSNALFRQVFAAGYTQSEEMFYAKIKGSRKPDGVIAPGNILEPGECGFSYIAGLTLVGDPNRPIVLTPLIPGTTKFDPKPFDGKAVALRIDNSAISYKISDDGHVYDKDGDILSPKHPFWKGKAPDIRYPE